MQTRSFKLSPQYLTRLRLVIAVAALLVLALVVSACAPAPSPSLSPSPSPTSTPVEPTSTAAPPTTTPIPSALPAIATPFPELKGDYLGQKKPALTPVPFAPEIFGDDDHSGYHLHSSVYFSLDGTEVYFTNQTLKPSQLTIWFMKQENEIWTEPQVAPFSGRYDDDRPTFSADGQRLYFTSSRPRSGSGESGEWGSWVVERTEAGWSEPEPIASPADIDTNDGTFYFGATLAGGQGDSDVYRTRYVDGAYTEPENLGDTINTEAEEYASCVAPDESYLIFYHFNPANKAGSGLYLSFHLPDDSWTEPVHLDSELGLDFGFDASLSPDGKHLFLLDRGKGVYWVDAKAIELFRPE